MSEVDTRNLEAEKGRLVNQVVLLEADRRALQQDAEHFRRRCWELEQENSALLLREDTVQGELREAHQRHRELAVRNIERSIATAEAENQQLRVQSEVRSQQWELERFERAVVAKSDEVDALRAELGKAREQVATWRAAFERCNAERTAFLQARDASDEARKEAEMRAFAIQERVERLDSALRFMTVRQTELIEEVDTHRSRCLKLEDANLRLRLDLQDAIARAVRSGEVPYYTAAVSRSGHAVSIEDFSSWSPKAPPAPPLSPKSRFDYPRSTKARQLRSGILNIRSEAADKIDALGQLGYTPRPVTSG